MNNFDKWMDEYENQLKLAIVNYPDEYVYDLVDVPKVSIRMKQAFKERTYNKDGRAIKACCKYFGIKYTYTAINNFLSGE